MEIRINSILPKHLWIEYWFDHCRGSKSSIPIGFCVYQLEKEKNKSQKVAKKVSIWNGNSFFEAYIVEKELVENWHLYSCNYETREWTKHKEPIALPEIDEEIMSSIKDFGLM